MYEIHLDIPDAIREHPVIRELEILAVDLIVIANVNNHLADQFTKEIH